MRKTPIEIAQTARDNGFIPTTLTALCELLMCADPTPLSTELDSNLKHSADVMARKLGFTDWVEAYHGLSVKATSHIHIAGDGENMDTCKQCGHDIRHQIHRRS